MAVQLDLRHHPMEEVLERYALGNARAAEIEPLEEHLLVCSDCQERLSETDHYIFAVRDATKILAGESLAKRPATNLWPVWAVGFAALAMALVMIPAHLRPIPAQEVFLETSRGAEPRLIQPVAAGRPFAINVAVTELAKSPTYALELLNDSGKAQWSGTARTDAGRLRAQVPILLAPGQYWVRIYLPSTPPSLLREFGLQAR